AARFRVDGVSVDSYSLTSTSALSASGDLIDPCLLGAGVRFAVQRREELARKGGAFLFGKHHGAFQEATSFVSHEAQPTSVPSARHARLVRRNRPCDPGSLDGVSCYSFHRIGCFIGSISSFRMPTATPRVSRELQSH